MSTKSKFLQCVMVGTLMSLMACGNIQFGDGSSNNQTSSNLSDETDVEAAFTSMVEEMSNVANSSSSATSLSVSSSETNYVTTGSTAYLGSRFNCSDVTTASESFSCGDGTLSRSVNFDDCEMVNNFHTVTLNGGHEVLATGGNDFCGVDSINMGKFVMVDSSADPATYTHNTSDSGFTRDFTNRRGHDVTITVEATKSITYTDPVDSDNDGEAESVTATIQKTINRTRDIDNGTTTQTVHNITVKTEDNSFTSTDSEGTETTVAVSLPTHNLTITDGAVTGRTITDGNLVVDHNLSNFRMVFGVGENGLSFDADVCGPIAGTMTVTGYTLNDDGTVGEQIATGSLTFALDGDGESYIESASYDGVALDLSPRPCD